MTTIQPDQPAKPSPASVTADKVTCRKELFSAPRTVRALQVLYVQRASPPYMIPACPPHTVPAAFQPPQMTDNTTALVIPLTHSPLYLIHQFVTDMG